MNDSYNSLLDVIIQNDKGPINSHMPGSRQVIKYLASSEKRELANQNEARRLAGLPCHTIKIRNCLACGAAFESVARRTCGCMAGKATDVLGHDLC